MCRVAWRESGSKHLKTSLLHKRPKTKSIVGLTPYLVIAVAPLCWAGNIVLARGIVDIVPPVTLAFWRWSIAFVLLLPFAWKQARRDWPIALAAWKILLLLSALGIAAFNTLLYMAMHSTTAINGALIQTAMPAVIIVLCWLLYRETVTGLQLLGVGLCVLGAGWVVLRGDWRAFVSLTLVEGDIMMMVAIVLYALYSVLLRRRPAIHPSSLLIYTFGMGSLMLLPAYGLELYLGHAFTLTVAAGLSILYVAVFPSIVAYFCWNRGVEVLGPNRAGLFINLIPVFASFMAIFWLQESLMPYHVLGMLMILAGMLMFNRQRG